MPITKVNMYRCDDGQTFDDLSAAQIHQQTIIADSKLSDFIVMECNNIVHFRDADELLGLVRAITKEFVVVRRSHPIDMMELESQIASIRGDGHKENMNLLVQLIMQTE